MRYQFEGFVLDVCERRLSAPDGTPVECTPKVLNALILLVENAGQLVGRDRFHDALWPRAVVAEDTLGKLIWQVRRALGSPGESLIETVPKHGYRLRAVAVEIQSDDGDSCAPGSGSPEAISSPPQAISGFSRLVRLGIVVTLMVTIVATLLIRRDTTQDSSTPAIDAGPLVRSIGAGAANSDSEAALVDDVVQALVWDLDLNRISVVDRAPVPADTLELTLVNTGNGGTSLAVDHGAGTDPVNFPLDLDADARKQLGMISDRLRQQFNVATLGVAQQRAREVLLPTRWDSLRKYAEATAAMRLRNHVMATSVLRDLLDREPDFVPAWERLSGAEFASARDSAAAAAARAGLSRGASVPTWLRLMLEIHLSEAEGRFDQALDRATALAQLRPDDYDALLIAARQFGRMGLTDRFDGFMDQLRELDPDSPEIDHLDAVIQLRAGRQELAIERADAATEKALAQDASGLAADALHVKARALAQAGRFRDALDVVTQAQRLVAESNPALSAALAQTGGSILLDLGDTEHAAIELGRAQAWFRAQHASFELSQIAMAQSQLAGMQGDLAVMQVRADEALKLANESGDPYLAVAQSGIIASAYLDAGETAVAARWFESGVVQAEHLGNPEFLAGLLSDWSRSAWQLGDGDRAHAAALRGLEAALAAQDWVTASLLSGIAADAAAANGDEVEALRRYQQAATYAERGGDALALARVARSRARRAIQCGLAKRAEKEIETARMRLGQARESSWTASLRIEHALVELLAAEYALAYGSPAQLAEALQKAREDLPPSPWHRLRVNAAMLQARGQYRDGNEDAALSTLRALGDLKARGQARLAAEREQLVATIRSGEPVPTRDGATAGCSDLQEPSE